MIWVDFMKRARKNPANKDNWKQGGMIFMTLAMTFNLGLVMAVFQKFILKKYFYVIYFTFLPQRLNDVLDYLILFILPCFIINYLLIYRNERYEKLFLLYRDYNGKLAAWYIVISFMLPALLVLAGLILRELNT